MVLGILQGLIPAIILYALKDALVRFFHSPEMGPMVIWVCLSLIINGFWTISKAKVLKLGRIKESGARETVANVFQLILSIAMVLKGYALFGLIFPLFDQQSSERGHHLRTRPRDQLPGRSRHNPQDRSRRRQHSRGECSVQPLIQADSSLSAATPVSRPTPASLTLVFMDRPKAWPKADAAAQRAHDGPASVGVQPELQRSRKAGRSTVEPLLPLLSSSCPSMRSLL